MEVLGGSLESDQEVCEVAWQYSRGRGRTDIIGSKP